MSRWDDTYKEFQTEWEQVKLNAQSIKSEKDTDAKEPAEDIDAEELVEIARLKRVIEYIDAIQKAGLKDVMPLDTIEQAIEASKEVVTSIHVYNEEEDPNRIIEANDRLDQVLTAICPFVKDSDSHAQAQGQAFNAYHETITSATSELEKSSKTLVSKIIEWHTDISQKHDEVSEAHNIFVVDDDKGMSQKTQLDEYYNEIIEFYKELLKDIKDEENEENNQDSIKTQIINAKDFVVTGRAEVETETTELKDFHEKIFGKKNKEGEREGGLKHEIEARQDSLSKYDDEQQKIIENLKNRIEGLLPGATSAGLSTAFRSLRKTSANAVRTYTKYFYWSLGGLFVTATIALIPELCYIFPKIFDFCIDPKADDFWLFWVRGLLAKSLFIVPALWFAIFTNKRRSEHQRLQQEYAHKEAVSKSFDGYKQQIDSLELTDKKLLTELLEIAIRAIGYNASATLGGKHGEGPPITEAVKMVKKINNSD